MRSHALSGRYPNTAEIRAADSTTSRWILDSLLALLVWVSRRIFRSPFGRLLRSIREDEQVTAAFGRVAWKPQIAVFIIGSFLAGIAGGLLIFYISAWSPAAFLPLESFVLLAALVVGGSGNYWGALLGAFVLIEALAEAARYVPNFGNAANVGALRDMVIGLVLILMLRYRPEGIVPELWLRWYRSNPVSPLQADESSRTIPAYSGTATEPATPPAKTPPLPAAAQAGGTDSQPDSQERAVRHRGRATRARRSGPDPRRISEHNERQRWQMSDGLTAKVSRFISSTPLDAVPPEAIRIAKHSILDGFGLAVAGARAEGVLLAAAEIASYGCRSGTSTVLGRGTQLPPRFAAFLNGLAIHADDFDDTQLAVLPDRVYGLLTHPTAPVLPVALALGERDDRNGRTC